MVGYLITLNNESSLEKCIHTDVYSMILRTPRYGN